MRFSTKVFEHAEIARWRHCNADSFKTLKVNYMLIRLMRIGRLSMSVKFCFEIPSDCWENCKKNLRAYFFVAPCI